MYLQEFKIRNFRSIEKLDLIFHKGVNIIIGENNSGKTAITLERIGRIPMPIDLKVDYADGTSENFHIPLRMMNFIKPNPNPNAKRTVLEDWAWAQSNYSFTIDKNKTAIKKITIDPSGLMADVKAANNVFEVK